MKKYVCEVCGYVYDEAAGDPENGIAPGTKWEDLPADYQCPLCGVGKDEFAEENQVIKNCIYSVDDCPQQTFAHRYIENTGLL